MSVLLLHRKLLQSSVTTNSSYNNLPNTNNEDVLQWSSTILALGSHVLTYLAILAVLVLMIFLIIKFFDGFDDQNLDEFGPTETNPLRPGKTDFVDYNYGTISGEDMEKGNCSSNSCNNSENKCSTSASEELYDGKLCVICYDEQRDCFFVPCGHCATCYVCAQRIFYSESKTCPVCRRLIGKVRRLFA